MDLGVLGSAGHGPICALRWWNFVRKNCKGLEYCVGKIQHILSHARHLYWSTEGLRYHPFNPCDAQVPLTVGFSWRITCVPGGANGVALLLNSPWSRAYPYSFGFMRNFPSKFSVRLACWRSQHHRCSSKSLWVLASQAIKWSLKVWMDRPAEFLRWILGGTDWNFSFTSLIKVLNTLGTRCT